MLMLRQLQATSDQLRTACARLEASIEATPNLAPQTVILDWLQAELVMLHQTGDEEDTGSQLLKEALALSNALKG
jgi:hypothetical protein